MWVILSSDKWREEYVTPNTFILFCVSCSWASSFQIVRDLGFVALDWFGFGFRLAAWTKVVPTPIGSQSAMHVIKNSPYYRAGKTYCAIT